jgi:tRNA uridine 5-carboxymethylaminomethyl modification enzyme
MSESLERKHFEIQQAQESLSRKIYTPTRLLTEKAIQVGLQPLSQQMTAAELLRRPRVTWKQISLLAESIGDPLPDISPDVQDEVELRIKFAGYIARQERAVSRVSKLEALSLPIDLDYDAVPSLRTQARIQLARVRPLTLGQAGRVEGVTPSDINILLLWLRRQSFRRVSSVSSS